MGDCEGIKVVCEMCEDIEGSVRVSKGMCEGTQGLCEGIKVVCEGIEEICEAILEAIPWWYMRVLSAIPWWYMRVLSAIPWWYMRVLSAHMRVSSAYVRVSKVCESIVEICELQQMVQEGMPAKLGTTPYLGYTLWPPPQTRGHPSSYLHLHHTTAMP